MRSRNDFYRCTDHIGLAAGKLAGFLTYALAFVILFDVIGRFIGHPTRWSLEISMYLTIWAGIIGAIYTTALEGHVAAEVFAEWICKLSSRIDFTIKNVRRIIMLIYSGYLTWSGILYVIKTYSVGKFTSDLEWPLYLHTLSVPLALGTMFFVIGVILLRALSTGIPGHLPAAPEEFRKGSM